MKPWSLAALGCAVLVYSAAVVQGRRYDCSPAGRSATMTAEQAADRTIALAPGLYPDVQSARLVVEPYAQPTLGGERPGWEAAWTDERGDHALRLIWLADTGELVYASVFGPRFEGAPAVHPLREHEAAEAARGWMGRLGFGRQGCQWRLADRPRRLRMGWRVVWRDSDRSATTWVSDADSGLRAVLASVDCSPRTRGSAGQRQRRWRLR